MRIGWAEEYTEPDTRSPNCNQKPLFEVLSFSFFLLLREGERLTLQHVWPQSLPLPPLSTLFWEDLGEHTMRSQTDPRRRQRTTTKVD